MSNYPALNKKQKNMIVKYIQNGLATGKHMFQFADIDNDYPELYEALVKVKFHESLWSDANRYWGDVISAITSNRPIPNPYDDSEFGEVRRAMKEYNRKHGIKTKEAPVTITSLQQALDIIVSEVKDQNALVYTRAVWQYGLTGEALRVQVLYILSNLNTWKGDRAKTVKAYLKSYASGKVTNPCSTRRRMTNNPASVPHRGMNPAGLRRYKSFMHRDADEVVKTNLPIDLGKKPTLVDLGTVHTLDYVSDKFGEKHGKYVTYTHKFNKQPRLFTTPDSKSLIITGVKMSYRGITS